MEVAQLLGLQGLDDTKCAGMMVASGTGAMALLVSSSSLWQLAFKEPPWLVLLWFIRNVIQAGRSQIPVGHGWATCKNRRGP